jgi:hypothetical protein
MTLPVVSGAFSRKFPVSFLAVVVQKLNFLNSSIEAPCRNVPYTQGKKTSKN